MKYLAIALLPAHVEIALASQAPQAALADVRRMVRASHNAPSLQPWTPPVPEVDLVARRGITVVPALLRLLPDDPDAPELSYYTWDEDAIIEGRQFD